MRKLILEQRRRVHEAQGLAIADLPKVGKPLREAALKQLRETFHVVPWPAFQRLRVAHITDVHAGISTPIGILRQAVYATRRARPDLVVLTGDYLNRTLKYVRRLRRFLASLPRPCVAVLGNHDYYSGADGVTLALQREGVTVLVNSSIELSLRGHRLPVVGLDDESAGQPDVGRAFHRVRDPKNALVLAHHPRTADAITDKGGRLILAGHTHGGQISVPWITGAISRIGGNRYLAGWYEFERGALFVNAGLGSGAVRIRAGELAKPEVAIIDLVPAHLTTHGNRPRRCTGPLPPSV